MYKTLQGQYSVHGQVILPVDDYFYSLQGLLSIHKQFYL